MAEHYPGGGLFPDDAVWAVLDLAKVMSIFRCIIPQFDRSPSLIRTYPLCRTTNMAAAMRLRRHEKITQAGGVPPHRSTARGAFLN